MTVTEKAVLDYIITFKTVNGYSPSTREIMMGVNSRSFHHINECLAHLRSDGYITYKDKSPRTINVIRFT